MRWLLHGWAFGCLVGLSVTGCRTVGEDSAAKSQGPEPSLGAEAPDVADAPALPPPIEGLGGLATMEGMFAISQDDDLSPTPYRLQFDFTSPTEVSLTISTALQGVWTLREENLPLTVTMLRCPGCYQFYGVGKDGPIKVTAQYLPTGFAGTPPTQVSISYSTSEELAVTELRFERVADGSAVEIEGPSGLPVLGGMSGDFTLAGLGISPAAGGVSEGEDYSLYLKFISSTAALLDISYRDERGYAEQQVTMRVITASCPGCYEFVGDGSLGAIRIRALHLPVESTESAGHPLSVKINFRGYANLPVSRIGFHQN